MDQRCIAESVVQRGNTIASEWQIECTLAATIAAVLTDFEAETGRGADVISGYRTRAAQEALSRLGRPTAADNRSNHRLFPSEGVDVTIGALPTEVMKATLGRIAVFRGLRWGGGSPVDSRTGIPSDWNHFDFGIRDSSRASGP